VKALIQTPTLKISHDGLKKKIPREEDWTTIFLCIMKLLMLSLLKARVSVVWGSWSTCFLSGVYPCLQTKHRFGNKPILIQTSTGPHAINTLQRNRNLLIDLRECSSVLPVKHSQGRSTFSLPTLPLAIHPFTFI